ncbi:MAG: D-aminoacyl-tRNA deacylase [Thermus sp.]|uniref:D-aminoacyl-tRNA deacylase n=1 Tax=unclassified Thermus TaxID=2619321 RepID=UPI000238A3ED|nr:MULTISPECIES: D-aminoacyl-tRNA deacylase [unclassified Thermus]AEV16301.1 D-tyrosyl-tRNA(Tyr) deacylase [Thermus sp. CCB_US3_UF1]MCS6867295.1 D-aminoacyl-tRNA deacylase [Thermus sp.]MCS7218996.1 D-aminoacyl-tRNA deacylase [Thermus sp.]MCX7850382.1 D-aminoacyl-tRNA deacylase [Thermus sp.]MDW8018418.1 D-aminoacyl-tRNA deacylase [Thermus sp.]
MRAVVQRVAQASVEVEGEVVGRIGLGLLVLLGVGQRDALEDALYLARKITALRIFPDEEGKMNLSLKEVGGEVLLVSQFTLYADTRKGNRPSFVKAAPPDLGRRLYEAAVEAFLAEGVHVETGVYGAHMRVHLVNDGPVTLFLDSEERFKPR